VGFGSEDRIVTEGRKVERSNVGEKKKGVQTDQVTQGGPFGTGKRRRAKKKKMMRKIS